MDIQSLIKLAHQADLEGNYRVADKLTERAIREAIFGPRRRPGTSFGSGGPSGFGGGSPSGGSPGGGTFGAPPGFGSMNQNNQGGHSGGGAGGPSGPISTGRVNTKGGDGGDAMGGDATNKNKGGRVTISPELAEAKRKLNAGEPLSAEEQKLIDKAAKNAERSREYRNKQKATGGDGNAGGGGGAGGNNTGATVDTRGGSSSAEGGSNNQQTNNARFRTRDIGGDVVGMGTMGSLALATVPTAIVAALGAYGYTMLNGRVVDQKTGQPVPPQNLPPQVQNLMSGGAKANPLALRTQENQMQNAQAAQMFIESIRNSPRGPAFKSAQDFWVAATQAGQTPSMVNQIVALAKAEGYPDKTPFTN
jgi:hypothetical protein